jgi:DNA-directed RNA polymerase sigma subunit (sigma70/sigma32)
MMSKSALRAADRSMMRDRSIALKYDCLMSLDDVAAALGLSNHAVQNIERRALSKFRAALARRGIGISDLLPFARACMDAGEDV